MVKDIVRLRGCFRLLFLYDVAEAIDLGMLQNLLGTHAGPVERTFPKRTPQYVRFEHVPIVEPVEPLPTGSDTKATRSIKYYAFGVVVVQVEIPFDCDWQFLLSESSRWMDAGDVGANVREVARRHLEHVARAVIRPTEDWLQETYLITELNEIQNEFGEQPTAVELLASHGGEIVQTRAGGDDSSFVESV